MLKGVIRGYTPETLKPCCRCKHSSESTNSGND